MNIRMIWLMFGWLVVLINDFFRMIFFCFLFVVLLYGYLWFFNFPSFFLFCGPLQIYQKGFCNIHVASFLYCEIFGQYSGYAPFDFFHGHPLFDLSSKLVSPDFNWENHLRQWKSLIIPLPKSLLMSKNDFTAFHAFRSGKALHV